MMQHTNTENGLMDFHGGRARPLAGLWLFEHLVFPPNGYQLTRKPIAWAMRLASLAFFGEALLGGNHIFVVEAVS